VWHCRALSEKLRGRSVIADINHVTIVGRRVAGRLRPRFGRTFGRSLFLPASCRGCRVGPASPADGRENKRQRPPTDKQSMSGLASSRRRSSLGGTPSGTIDLSGPYTYIDNERSYVRPDKLPGRVPLPSGIKAILVMCMEEEIRLQQLSPLVSEYELYAHTKPLDKLRYLVEMVFAVAEATQDEHPATFEPETFNMFLDHHYNEWADTTNRRSLETNDMQVRLFVRRSMLEFYARPAFVMADQPRVTGKRGLLSNDASPRRASYARRRYSLTPLTWDPETSTYDVTSSGGPSSGHASPSPRHAHSEHCKIQGGIGSQLFTHVVGSRAYVRQGELAHKTSASIKSVLAVVLTMCVQDLEMLGKFRSFMSPHEYYTHQGAISKLQGLINYVLDQASQVRPEPGTVLFFDPKTFDRFLDLHYNAWADTANQIVDVSAFVQKSLFTYYSFYDI